MSDSSPPRGEEHVWETLERYTGGRVTGLQKQYLSDSPAAKAALAQLRRCDPASDEGVLEAWEIAFSGAPSELIGRGDAPTRAERALATALHLYALHQQSKQDPMHAAGKGLGSAIRKLASPEDPDSRERPVMRRYHALTTATERTEVLHHLRGLIRQLRDAGIPIDYARLASDLYFLSSPGSRTRVRLAWARDLTRRPRDESTDPEQSTAA